MRVPKRLLWLQLFLLLVTGAVTWAPQQATAIAPLSYQWWCEPPDGICDFTVTSNNHAMYQWNFGDGTFHGPTTSKSTSHDYASGPSYTVYLIGYATNPPSSPDNIVGCTVEPRFGWPPGGDPTGGVDSGTCN